jgi:hypothetical protein
MLLGLLRELIDLGVGVFGLVVFAVLALSGEIGFRIGRGRARAATSPDTESAGVSTLTTGMLGLLAFTLALTIGLAQDRFEARRHATLDEANTIGTAWLRTQLAGASGKPIAALIEDYARGRLDYLVAVNPNTADEALARTNALQTAIWQRSLTVLAGMPQTLTSALIASLNDMFDASLVQRYAMQGRAPTETMLMLLGGAMLAVGALGYQMAFRSTAAYPGPAPAADGQRRHGADYRFQPAASGLHPDQSGSAGLDDPRLCGSSIAVR